MEKMNLYCLITILCLKSFTVYAFDFKTVELNGYFKWSPFGQPNSELNCPNLCVAAEEDCCQCKAKRCWEINATACGVVVDRLYLEPTDIFFNAVVVADPNTNATYFELIHRNGRLTSLPANLCDWANTTVTIDLTFNRLKNISSLKCMVVLDKLLLDNNSIEYLDNRTFAGMEHLRTLSMAHNGMHTIEPNAIAIQAGNIPVVDLSWNLFTEVDVTNIYRKGSFCKLDYEGNTMTSLGNQLNFTADTGPVLGPGDINLNKTHLGTMYNFTNILVDYTALADRVKGRLYIDDSQMSCDCGLHKMIAGIGRPIFELWGNVLGNFICRTPEAMKGFNLSDIYEGDNINLLVCDLKADCPRFCTCIDMPDKYKVLVNCSSRGLTELPSDVPVGAWNNKNVDLLLENNNIKQIENRNYVNRLVNLDMTGNPVSVIEESFAQSMSGDLTVEIEQQILRSLPRQLEAKDPRHFRFGPHPIECSCDSAWVGSWMRRHETRGRLSCVDSAGTVVDTAAVSADSLGCFSDNQQENSLASPVIVMISLLVLVVLMLLTLVTWFYRYEILLLKRGFINNKSKMTDMKYDVFLSFCEINDGVFSWVSRFLLPALEQNGYTVFCPWFSINFGDRREHNVANMARISQHYVICLCNSYLSDVNSVMDFNIIWKNFIMDTSKRITVINFAHVRKRDIQDKRIRAFRKIRDDLDYKCTTSKLWTRLKRRLGPPQMRNDEPAVGQHQEPQVNKTRNDEGTQHRHPPRTFEKAGDPPPPAAEHVDVFERLYYSRSSCNCKYRTCYLYPDHAVGSLYTHRRAQSRASTARSVERFKGPPDTASVAGASAVSMTTSDGATWTHRKNPDRGGSQCSMRATDPETSSVNYSVNEIVLPNAIYDQTELYFDGVSESQESCTD